LYAQIESVFCNVKTNGVKNLKANEGPPSSILNSFNHIYLQNTKHVPPYAAKEGVRRGKQAQPLWKNELAKVIHKYDEFYKVSPLTQAT
jgi:hypothetical protein